jgi:hypothetical protein
MTAVYIILGIFAYLAIGGFLSGLFREIGLADYMWYVSWPFTLIILLFMIMLEPFERLGYWVLTKFRDTKNRKKK